MATATMNTALTAPGTPPAAGGNEPSAPARSSETGLAPVRGSDITRSATSTALTDPTFKIRLRGTTRHNEAIGTIAEGYILPAQ